MSLRSRILAVLCVLIALNALFVLALLWAYGVLLVGVVAGALVYLQHGRVAFDFLRLPVSWWAYVLLVAGFLGAQMYYGYRRVLAGTHGTASGDEHAVAGTVRRLAMTADVPEPNVRVVEDEAPSCYTIGRFTDATIVVTTGLIDALDADELTAVLAHEVAHIANRDVTLMTITTLFLEIADRAYHAARLARRALADPDELSGRARIALLWFAPLVALTYVFVSPILWVFPTIADWATRTLSHAREFAADEAAARTTGQPLALATALVTLAETTPAPRTDLRTAKTRALCIVPTDPIRGRETVSVPVPGRPVPPDQRREHVRAWLDGTTPSQAAPTEGHSATHPPVEARIRRLGEIAAELEEATGA